HAYAYKAYSSAGIEQKTKSKDLAVKTRIALLTSQDDIQTKIDELADKIATSENLIKQYEDEKAFLHPKKRECQSKIKDCQMDMEAVERQVQAKERRIGDLKKDLSSKHKEISRLQGIIKSSQSAIEKIEHSFLLSRAGRDEEDESSEEELEEDLNPPERPDEDEFEEIDKERITMRNAYKNALDQRNSWAERMSNVQSKIKEDELNISECKGSIVELEAVLKSLKNPRKRRVPSEESESIHSAQSFKRKMGGGKAPTPSVDRHPSSPTSDIFGVSAHMIIPNMSSLFPICRRVCRNNGGKCICVFPLASHFRVKHEFRKFAPVIDNLMIFRNLHKKAFMRRDKYDAFRRECNRAHVRIPDQIEMINSHVHLDSWPASLKIGHTTVCPIGAMLDFEDEEVKTFFLTTGLGNIYFAPHERAARSLIDASSDRFTNVFDIQDAFMIEKKGSNIFTNRTQFARMLKMGKQERLEISPSLQTTQILAEEEDEDDEEAEERRKEAIRRLEEEQETNLKHKIASTEAQIESQRKSILRSEERIATLSRELPEFEENIAKCLKERDKYRDAISSLREKHMAFKKKKKAYEASLLRLSERRREIEAKARRKGINIEDLERERDEKLEVENRKIEDAERNITVREQALGMTKERLVEAENERMELHAELEKKKASLHEVEEASRDVVQSVHRLNIKYQSETKSVLRDKSKNDELTGELGNIKRDIVAQTELISQKEKRLREGKKKLNETIDKHNNEVSRIFAKLASNIAELQSTLGEDFDTSSLVLPAVPSMVSITLEKLTNDDPTAGEEEEEDDDAEGGDSSDKRRFKTYSSLNLNKLEKHVKEYRHKLEKTEEGESQADLQEKLKEKQSYCARIKQEKKTGVTQHQTMVVQWEEVWKGMNNLLHSHAQAIRSYFSRQFSELGLKQSFKYSPPVWKPKLKSAQEVVEKRGEFVYMNEMELLKAGSLGFVLADRRDNTSLSGGEQVYTSLCFITACWYVSHVPCVMVDELDVFLDHRRATKAWKIIYESTRKKDMCQFVFITPNEVDLATVGVKQKELKERINVMRLKASGQR
ncbi:Structural maintenance of chromosomes protein 6 like protein, partial [Aduncisulcus paluster]